MMNDFERQLGAALSRGGGFDEQRAACARKEIVTVYKKKLRTAMAIAWAAIAVAVVMEVAGFVGLVLSLAMGGDVRLMILFAVIALSGGQFHLLAKLWYWIMNCRYKVQEDVKQLRLEVAEMAGRG